MNLLLRNKEMKHDISEKLYRRKNGPEFDRIMRDVEHGKILQRLYGNSDNLITFNLGFDGAPIFNKSSQSLWPLQIMINDATFQHRCGNMLLASVLFHSGEPTIELTNVIISGFLEQLRKLNEKKVSFTSTITGNLISLQFSINCVCVFDSKSCEIQCLLRLSFLL